MKNEEKRSEYVFYYFLLFLEGFTRKPYFLGNPRISLARPPRLGSLIVAGRCISALAANYPASLSLSALGQGREGAESEEGEDRPTGSLAKPSKT